MSRVSAPSSRSLVICGFLSAALVSACGPVTDPAGDSSGAKFAKAAAGPAVTAALPSYAHQGDVGVDVRILGTGFDQGSVASWERGGIADPKVNVRSTRFVSSTELVATIDVAPDATIALYDVAVTTSTRKKGIGMERFTVTVAQSIGSLGGNTLARAVNDQGATVGYSMLGSSQHAFFAGPDAAMSDLGVGQAYDLDAAGGTVVGWTGGEAVVWRGSGTAWASSRLPDNGAGSRATTIITTTPSGLLIGGSVAFRLSGNKTQDRPALWRESAPGWILQTFLVPTGFANAWIEDVNANGQAVGVGRDPYSKAYLWEANGTAVALPSLAGDRTAFANGIDPTGALIVGQSGSQAVYWKKNATGQWTVNVLETCGRATDINGKGMIVGQGCQNATLWLLATDGSVTRRQLPGLGANLDAPAVEGINNAEFPLAAGQAQQQGSPTGEGVLWNLSALSIQ
jgi:probable HAF family extracellular repeat protein